jgi:hypothetical protein
MMSFILGTSRKKSTRDVPKMEKNNAEIGDV